MLDLTAIRMLILLLAITSTVFGFMLLFSPESVHKLSQALNRTIITLDTIIGKQPRVSGSIMLLVGIPLGLLLLVY